MEKRILSLVITLSMLISVFSAFSINVSAANTPAFNDIDGTEYYAESVRALSSKGLISGYGDGSFKPESTITRAELAAIICRMIGKEDDARASTGKTIFHDVNPYHWATGYINVACKEDIINGYGNGTFQPEVSVKYEEAIKMVICALGLGDDVTTYANDWSKGYIEMAETIGITEHLKGKKGKASTRGEVAVMVDYGLRAIVNGRYASNLEKDGLEVTSWNGKSVVYKNYSTTYNSDYSYCLVAEEADDLRLKKSFKVKKNTWYCISAYFKTENVINHEANKIGANISSGDWEISPKTVLGDTGWTKIKLIVNSKERDTINTSFNLGYWSNTCSGKVYIDGVECKELENDSSWKLLFVILKETNINHTTPSGTKIKSTNVMSPKEIEILKEAADISEVDFNKYSDGLIKPFVDVVVIDEPLADVDNYGDKDVYLSVDKAYDFLKDKVDIEKYDHITVFANLNMPTSYFGLGGMIFKQFTGYSFINTQSKSYSLWAFDKNEKWVTGCMLHEFLHFIETWSNKLDEKLPIALHDAEKLGYTDKDEWKSWYRDFMTKKVAVSDGNYVGVSPVVWRHPPHLFR